MLKHSPQLLARLASITARAPTATAPLTGACYFSTSATHDQASAAGSAGWGWRPLAAAAAAGAGLAVATGGAPSTSSLISPAHAEKAQPASVQVPDNPYQRPTQLQGLPGSFTLYQYEVCPFCCKAKAVLDYCKLPYKVVEVNPLTKGELRWSSYRKVPVLQWDDGSGKVEVDSSAIMSRLAAEVVAAAAPPAAPPPPPPTQTTTKSSWFGSSSTSQRQQQPVQVLQPPPPAHPLAAPASAAALAEEEQWRRWVDERLVKVITANIYRSWDESKETFKYITTQTNWSWGTREAARWSGALLMWQVGKRMPAKYGIQGDLRDALISDCNKWVDAVGPDQPFYGGSAPGLADLAVYGVLRAVWHTPTFEAAMTNSRIKPWYDRVEAAIGPSSCVN